MYQCTCRHCTATFESAHWNNRYCPACAGLCRDCGRPRDHNEPSTVRCHACHAQRIREHRHSANQGWKIGAHRRARVPTITTAPDGGLTQAEAARRLGVSRERVRQLVNAGQLPTPITAEAVEARRLARLAEKEKAS
jgi:hypothetical protein